MIKNDFGVYPSAKINLFLAITGRRTDGFHDLVSVVARLSLADDLGITAGEEGSGFSLTCSDAAVPLDGSNLILRAAEAYRVASGWKRGAEFILKKKIPMGAGLGGGSSDAAWALWGLNQLADNFREVPKLSEARIEEIASEIGSDCALFLHRSPVVIRGRGERVSPLPEGVAKRLLKRRVLIFKPDVSINTAWAYRQLAARAPESYLPAEQAEARLAAWIDSDAPAEDLLFNNMEPVAFEKFVALPVLLARLRERFGVAAGMSGSGSACFALLRENQEAGEMIECVREAWGRDAFVAEARIL